MSGCSSGKVSYATRGEAMATVRKASVRRGMRAVDAYRCPDCGAWHLASIRRR